MSLKSTEGRNPPPVGKREKTSLGHNEREKEYETRKTAELSEAARSLRGAGRGWRAGPATGPTAA